jgi:hypothetical protein
METTEQSNTKIVKAGFDRICKEFSALILPLGFSKTKARDWSRVENGQVDVIHLHRNGASYGSPTNYSVSIRVHFATHAHGMEGPFSLNGPSSAQLKDSKGYSYHLRFNAHSWSTYDRCLADLVRVTNDHGLPWFAQQKT